MQCSRIGQSSLGDGWMLFLQSLYSSPSLLSSIVLQYSNGEGRRKSTPEVGGSVGGPGPGWEWSSNFLATFETMSPVDFLAAYGEHH